VGTVRYSSAPAQGLVAGPRLDLAVSPDDRQAWPVDEASAFPWTWRPPSYGSAKAKPRTPTSRTPSKAAPEIPLVKLAKKTVA
jgi:hypothetical protein